MNAGINIDYKKIKLNSTQEKIIELINQNKYTTQEDMSEKLNKNIRTIQRNIKKLQIEKIVERVGTNKDGYWKITE
ncbi:MAG TPA: transcriptional regulator [Clostridiales bacterium]|nr:transcriptional regulator [Clostridiales bacterium]